MQQLTVALMVIGLSLGAQACGSYHTCEECAAADKCGWTGSSCKSYLTSLLFCRGSGGAWLCNPYQCASSPPAYDELFAKTLWQLQGAGKVATSDPGFTGCLNNADAAGKLHKRINVSCGVPFGTDRCVTDVYVLPGSKSIAAISLGSEGTSQLLQVLLQLTVPLLENGVLTYWHNAFTSLWSNGLQDAVSELLLNPAYADYKFVSSGHSLGGAVALLVTKAVAEAKWRGGNDIQTITFGQPRLGSFDFQESIYKVAPYHFRLKNSRDAITSLPCQIGCIEHSKYPVYYPIGMNSTGLAAKVICNTNEDPACTTNFEIADLLSNYHNTYFNIDNVETWHNTNCAY